MKRAQLISADLSFQILGILLHLNLGGPNNLPPPLVWSYPDGEWQLRRGAPCRCAPNPLYSPRNEHSPTEFGRRVSREISKNRRLFPGANLIQLDPATGVAPFHSRTFVFSFSQFFLTIPHPTPIQLSLLLHYSLLFILTEHKQ